MLKSKSKNFVPSTAEPHEIYLYALFDVKANSFGSTFEARSDDLAKRSIAHHIVCEPTSLFATYPSDYQLWRVGCFNRDLGHFIYDSVDVSEHLCTVSALLPRQSTDG